jgi:hypothetical protein
MVMLRKSDEENGKLLRIILQSLGGFTPTLMHNITYYLQLRENFWLSFRNHSIYIMEDFDIHGPTCECVTVNLFH